MVAAQKAAATMRDRVSTREKEGDVLGADRAMRKADELAELADRASAAVDAFRDLGKAAEDAATQALEAQVEAAAALERTFDEIDRDVAQRREAAANPDRNPTSGFANFHDALDAMADALKREATLRAEASALERAGKLGEARQALLAAEAVKAMAEQVPAELGGMLVSGLGSATSAMMQGAEAGSAAGPEGAAVGAVVGLLSQSEAFQGALNDLEVVFQALADSVGKLIEPLLPIITVVAEVAAGLGSLLEALSPIVEFVARPLFEVLKYFGIVVLNLVRMVGEIINGFAQMFGGKGFDLTGIDKALGRLEAASYDAAKEQQKVAEAARQATEGIHNVPSWWRASLARFNATDPRERGSSVSITDNSTTHIHIPPTETATAHELAKEVVRVQQEKKERNTGSKYGDASEQWVP
jgi:hypothetical protein